MGTKIVILPYSYKLYKATIHSLPMMQGHPADIYNTLT